MCCLILWSLILLREFLYCILDGMIHSIFIYGVFYTATYFSIHFYKETGDSKYNKLSILAALATVGFSFAIGYSSLKFDTIEIVNVALGYVYVEVLDNDMFLVSNGREVAVDFISGHRDLYLVNKRNSEEILINHYKSRYPELKEKYYEDKLTFEVGEENKLAISTSNLSERYFSPTELNLWRMSCYDKKYKRKNIFGGNGFYQ